MRERIEKVKNNLVSKRDEENKKMNNTIIIKDNTFLTKQDIIIKKKELPKLKKYSIHKKKYEEKSQPGPGEYEVRQNITQMGKGFTFGTKTYSSNEFNLKTMASLIKFPSEFDTIECHPK